jgi:hypothetical protein|tara:strand:- start:359 stop:640 length:282 start_codon:yes stop_codon:yes gene_type:complete
MVKIKINKGWFWSAGQGVWTGDMVGVSIPLDILRNNDEVLIEIDGGTHLLRKNKLKEWAKSEKISLKQLIEIRKRKKLVRIPKFLLSEPPKLL